MKFSLSDGLVTLLVVLLSSYLLYLFWLDFNGASALHRGDELGTIEFRKRSATRRSEGNLNWERLKNLSPVYEGDYIRTADLSEAVITFSDSRSSISLFENSMMKLNLQGEEEIGSFISGQMTLTGGEGKSIRAGDRLVTFSEDSRLSLSRVEDEITIAMDEGTALISSDEGEEEVLGAAQELHMDANTGEYEIIEHGALPVEPAQNERLLVLGKEDPSVSFAWDEVSPGSLPEEMFLVYSPHENLEGAVRVPVRGKSAELSPGAGVWYWRLEDEKGDISSIRRFSLDRDQPCLPILPKNGASWSYRRILPSIPFSWSPMENASAYVFEVSAEPEFRHPLVSTRTPMNSLTVNALDEGIWYWRVSPVLSHRPVGEMPSAQVRRISLVKREKMQPPPVSYPPEDSLYQIQDLEGQGVPFSWQPEAEAVDYELLIADNRDMTSPSFSFESPRSFVFLDRSAASVLENPGVYYWSVRWRDGEDNESPWSEPRRLQGIDGSVAVRLSYPPDNYRIADSLVSGTRFAWKSNVPGLTLFQVAADEGFEEILYEEEVQAETLLGKEWGPGQWFWRIRTFNADGTVFLDTRTRRFTVAPPLAGPALIQPVRGRIHIFREGEEQTLRWREIPGADYYSLNLISSDTGETVFAGNLIYDNQISLSMDSFEDGPYEVRLQAFALETPSSTRIIGYLENSNFILHKLLPAELVSPARGERFDGLDALRRGVILEWTAKDEPDSSVLKLFREPDRERPVLLRHDAPRAVAVKSLSEGDYFWTLEGSLEGFDVSAETAGRFTVDPIIPLPPPVLTTPEEGGVYGPEQLRQSREIRFAWEAVQGASEYILNIFAKDRSEPLLSREGLAANGFVLEDLALLDRGEFLWTVTGDFRNGKGIVEQPGETARGEFSIDLPRMEALELTSGDIFFGH